MRDFKVNLALALAGIAVIASVSGPAPATGSARMAAHVVSSVIQKNAVGSKQIKDGSITEHDLAPKVVAKLASTGAKGDTGPKGDAGPRGDAGPPGSSGIATTGSVSISIPAIPPNACAEFAASVAGTQVGDTVLLQPENGSSLPTGVILEPVGVTGAGAVRIRVCNVTQSSTIYSTSATVSFRYLALRG